jgi:hypothetical protein
MYTSLGRIVAFLIVAVGLPRIGMGLHVVVNFEGDSAAVSGHLGSAANSETAIDQGIYTLLAGMTLGVVVEISMALTRMAKQTTEPWENAA